MARVNSSAHAVQARCVGAARAAGAAEALRSVGPLPAAARRVREIAAIGVATAGLPLLAGLVTGLHFVTVFGYGALTRHLPGGKTTRCGCGCATSMAGSAPPRPHTAPVKVIAEATAVTGTAVVSSMSPSLRHGQPRA